MENPVQKVSRLLGALETLLEQQSFFLSSGQFGEALAGQALSQPLVEEIAALMAVPETARSLDSETRQRADLFLQRQLLLLERLALDKAAVQSELHQISLAQSRTHRLRGAYRDLDTSAPTHGYSSTA